MPNTKQEAVQGIQAFFESDARVLLVNGTHQHKKHPLVIASAVAFTPPGTSILFRCNHRHNAGDFLRPLGITRVPKAGQAHRIDKHLLYVDTINRTSWNKSPYSVDVAIVYPVDSLGSADKGGRCVEDLLGRHASKVCLVTWTDNKSFRWIDPYAPVRVTYDAEEEDLDYHRRVREVEVSCFTEPPIGELPQYARSGDPNKLLRLFCRGCGQGRWAELNVEYPGIETIRKSPGMEYEAKCLHCGTIATDNYNWFGRS